MENRAPSPFDTLLSRDIGVNQVTTVVGSPDSGENRVLKMGKEILGKAAVFLATASTCVSGCRSLDRPTFTPGEPNNVFCWNPES